MPFVRIYSSSSEYTSNDTEDETSIGIHSTSEEESTAGSEQHIS